MDLIFGAPGQSLKDWRQDLETALRFEIDHLSTYGLTYERGTPLWKRRERGEVQSLPEETEREMYAKAIDMLSSVGFEQYEISSFARPGRRCLHNQVYWANEAYFGFGMGAARYVERRRELNTRDLVTYIQRVERGDSPTFQSERLDDEERARETMAIQLRRVEGINRQRFQEQTEWSLDDVAGDAIARQVRQGFLFDDGERVALTHEGKFVADAVIEELL